MCNTDSPLFEISIENARFLAYHGVFHQENRVGNTFDVSAKVTTPVSSQIKNDELGATISYADLYELIKAEMTKPSRLLEHVCLRIATEIKTKWPYVQSGEIKIVKLQPPISGCTGSAAVKIFF